MLHDATVHAQLDVNVMSFDICKFVWAVLSFHAYIGIYKDLLNGKF